MKNTLDAWTDESLFCREDAFGVRYYYKDKWAKIEDNHFGECPVSIAAAQKRISTCCMCDKLELAATQAAAMDAECMRCHNLAEDCKCGAKAQLV